MDDIKNMSFEKREESAKRALDRADSKELYEHYKLAMDESETVIKTLDILSAHYSGKSEAPRLSPGIENAIQSMERVALAAIDLAKSVIEKTKPPQ